MLDIRISKIDTVRTIVSGRRAIIGLATLPLLLFYAVFLIFPISYAFAMSFTNWNPASLRLPLRYVGFDNYSRIMFDDPLFWVALRNTAYYTVLDIFLGTIIALVLAAMINSVKHGKSFFRTVYFLPVLTSMVAAALVWRWVYQPRYGLLNSALAVIVTQAGLPMRLPDYLSDSRLVMPALAAMTIWKGLGYTVVIFLAGLQNIPDTFYEAARVDGAGRFKSFWYITLPLLRPTTVFVVLTGIIGAFQVFVPMFIMTKGGPFDATRTVVYLLYDEAFVNSRFGYASAISFVLFVIVLALTLLQRRALRTSWSY